MFYPGVSQTSSRENKVKSLSTVLASIKSSENSSCLDSDVDRLFKDTYREDHIMITFSTVLKTYYTRKTMWVVRWIEYLGTGLTESMNFRSCLYTYMYMYSVKGLYSHLCCVKMLVIRIVSIPQI